MNPETQAIAQFETSDGANDAGYTIPLTDKEAALLRTMNRHDRRAHLSQMRKQAGKLKQTEEQKRKR